MIGMIGVGVGLAFHRRSITTILSDLFNRADSATSMGNADTSQVWSAPIGTWGISSNRAYCVSDVSGDVASIDSGASNFTLSATLNGQTSATNQRYFNLMFRGLNATNFLYARLSANAVQIYKNVTGTSTQLATATVTPPADNTDFTLKVVCSGNTVQVFLNGVLALTHTLSGGDTAFSSYTKVGLRLTKAGSPTGAARADNFVVEI